MYYFIKGLSSVSVTYNKVLTDEDVIEIRKDFLLGFNNGYMERVAVNVIVFIVSEGLVHTLRYWLKNDPRQSQENRESAAKWLSRINYVDDLQIVVQDKTL